jgi:hypothetical protein
MIRSQGSNTVHLNRMTDLGRETVAGPRPCLPRRLLLIMIKTCSGGKNIRKNVAPCQGKNSSGLPCPTEAILRSSDRPSVARSLANLIKRSPEIMVGEGNLPPLWQKSFHHSKDSYSLGQTEVSAVRFSPTRVVGRPIPMGLDGKTRHCIRFSMGDLSFFLKTHHP